jgi:hypothetical protein
MALKRSKSPMSAKNTVHLITRSSELPAISRAARM